MCLCVCVHKQTVLREEGSVNPHLLQAVAKS